MAVKRLVYLRLTCWTVAGALVAPKLGDCKATKATTTDLSSRVELLVDLGYFELATRQWQRQPSTNGVDGRTAFFLALACSRSGKEREDTLALYKVAVKQFPYWARAWFNLGVSLGQEKRYKEAAQAFLKAREVVPESKLIEMSLKRLPSEAYSGGNMREASKVVSPEGIAKNDAASYHLYRAEFLLKGESSIEPRAAEYALKEAQKAVEVDKDSGLAWLTLGLCQNECGLLEESVTSFNKAVELNGSPLLAKYYLTSNLFRLGYYQKAREHAEELVNRVPDCGDTYLGLALCLSSLRVTADAIGIAEKAVKLIPAHHKSAVEAKLLLRQLEEEQRLIVGFRELSGDHATVISDPILPERLSSKVLSLFERGWNIAKQELGFEPPNRFWIFLLSSPEFIQRVYGGQQLRYLRLANKIYLVFDGPRSLALFPLDWTNPLRTYLAMAVEKVTRYRAPNWLVTGLSAILAYEYAPRVYTRWIRELKADVQYIPLERLESGKELPETKQAQQLAHVEGIVAAYLLVKEHGMRAVRSLLESCRSGRSFSSCLQDVLGLSYAELDQKVREFLEQQKQFH